MIRVVLADDHGVIRDGLGRLISALDDVELVGLAADGAQAVEQCARLHPDVVLMDLDMPVMDGITATAELADSEAKVVILTASARDGDEERAAAAGAVEFLTKDQPIADVAGAVLAAAA